MREVSFSQQMPLSCAERSLTRPLSFRPQEWHRKKLNQRWFDVGFAGKPGQCDEDDGTCYEMEEELNFIGRVESDKSGRYRYLVDVSRSVTFPSPFDESDTQLLLYPQVDGNGWSSRFRRLLSSGSCVTMRNLASAWPSADALSFSLYQGRSQVDHLPRVEFSAPHPVVSLRPCTELVLRRLVSPVFSSALFYSVPVLTTFSFVTQRRHGLLRGLGRVFR